MSVCQRRMGLARNNKPDDWHDPAAVSRAAVTEQTHGFQETNVSQLAVTVPEDVESAFLQALGLGKRLVATRELISLE